MKKLLFTIPLFIFSCTKKEANSTTSLHQDSLQASPQVLVADSLDATNSGVITLSKNPKPKEISKTFRVIEGAKIIKTINGDMIPLTIAEEFTPDHQQLVLKIKNFSGKLITGKITPENPQMNIRFNQIKLANDSYDGPFGRDFTYNITEDGEIWIIISKSNMASGETIGKFTVALQ